MARTALALLLLILVGFPLHAQYDSIKVRELHDYPDTFRIGTVQVLLGTWTCPNSGETCTEDGADESDILTELSVDDHIILQSGSYWYSYTVSEVGGTLGTDPYQFKRTRVLPDGTVDILRPVVSSQLKKIGTGVDAVLRVVYDGQGGATAFLVSTTGIGSSGFVQGLSFLHDGGELVDWSAGSPEGAVTAPPGSIAGDSTGGELYVKQSGVGNTGWTKLGLAAHVHSLLEDGDGVQDFSYDGSGPATVAVDFAGTGAAVTASRSDHGHVEADVTDLEHDAVKIQGRDVAADAPSDGEAIVWNTSGGTWEPSVVAAAQADRITDVYYNNSGATIYRGDPVYLVGWNAIESLPEIAHADADDPVKMPAVGLSVNTVLTGTSGEIIAYGPLTDADTSLWAVGNSLYVSDVLGELTNVRPSGASTGVQKVGQVLKSDASTGIIWVFGAGRTNDVPNLATGKYWRGDGSGVAQEVDIANDDLPVDRTADTLTIDTANLDVRLRRLAAGRSCLDDGDSVNCDAVLHTELNVSVRTEGVGAPYAIPETETGTWYTNEGATAQVYADLPSAADGLAYGVFVQDTDGFRITAAAGDTIRLDAIVSAAGGYIEITGLGSLGSAVYLTAVNATEWTGFFLGGWQVDGVTTVTLRSLMLPDATTAKDGVVELATQVEVDAGTDTVRAVTPATLAGWIGGVRSQVLAFTIDGQPFIETNAISWTVGARLVYAGSDAVGAPTSIRAIAYSNTAAETAYWRVYDLTNALVIADGGSVTSTTPTINVDATLTNIPTGEAIWELQYYSSSGGGVNAHCSGIEIRW